MNNGSGARVPSDQYRARKTAERVRRNERLYAHMTAPLPPRQEHQHTTIRYDRAGAYEHADPCFCAIGKNHGERINGD